MVAIDYHPLAYGYIASLAQPGQNITGVVVNQIELTAKRLELLKEAVPTAARVLGALGRSIGGPAPSHEHCCCALKMPLVSLELRGPPYDYAQVLADADGRRGDASSYDSPSFSG